MSPLMVYVFITCEDFVQRNSINESLVQCGNNQGQECKAYMPGLGHIPPISWPLANEMMVCIYVFVITVHVYNYIEA